MRTRTTTRREERARLGELAEAISEQLAGGRSKAAVARDLLQLGFDRKAALRLVGQVARRNSAPPARVNDRGHVSGRARRLLTDTLLLLAGAGVVFTCVSAQEHGAPLYIASFAILAAGADAIGALAGRPRPA
jgi:hypothetical protein